MAYKRPPSSPPTAPASGDDLGFISPRLILLIEDNADALSKRWLEVVTSHADTPTYHDYDRKKLYERAFDVYSQLGRWLSAETTKGEIDEKYSKLGAQRRREGFAIGEVMQALMITRRVLWQKIEAAGLLDTATDLNIALRLNNHVILFFDRAVFFVAKGYESAG
jgi:hypothetical protein